MDNLKFSDCSKCPLNNNLQKIVAGECNTKKLSDVDLLIIAEAPAKEEIKEDKPLVGTSGKVFREAFEESKLCKSKYLITNAVLCSNLDMDGCTYNPP